MNYFLFFTSISVLLVCVSVTKMSSCTDSEGIFPNVTYSVNSYVCEATPCICTMGCPSVIAIDFYSPRYLEKIKPYVNAFCMGLTIPYPLGQDDACAGINNTQCPIVENEKVHYEYSLTILPIFPEVTVTLTFTITDEELGTDVVCFQWDIEVKRSSCPL